MEVTVNVLGDPLVAADGLPAYREHSNGPMLGINVSIPDRSTQTLFDIAHVRLQGAIKSRIGEQSSVQKILNVVEYCPWSQFIPMHPSPSAASTTYSAKLDVDMSEKAAARSIILPSTTVSGSAYITQQTALNDRRRVQGCCETYYWVNVDLFKDGALFHQHQQKVRLECYPTRVLLASFKGNEHPASALCQPSKSLMRSAITGISARKAIPTVEMSITHIDQPLVFETLPTGERLTAVDLPLEASFSELPSSLLNSTNTASGLTCDVEAKWFTKRSFAAGSDEHAKSGRFEIINQLASTQVCEVKFPPLASPPSEEAESHHPASAVGMLRLVLPASASMPTVESDLLKVSYELELKYTVHLGGTKPGLLKGRTRLGCILA